MSADEQRKLAAIMFTDMVGYSALSQRDEKLAQELLEEHRRVLRPIFPQFNGTEVKTIGDAFLVEFGSALEAAQCAIEIQRTLAKRNHDVPADRRIEIRIGVHIGDVVHRGGDVYGDGVNIASRIEPVAGPGGICVSMDVERQIRNALEARFEKLAPTDLKNISVPMDLFRIVLPWERQTASAAKSEIRNRQSGRRLAAERSDKSETRRMPWHEVVLALLLVVALIAGGFFFLRHRASPQASNVPASSSVGSVPEKSIAVLPFENFSQSKENEFFADGVQDDILTALSKVADLKVISRTSVMTYAAGAKRNLREIAQALGVSHILEGSVRRADGKVRVSAQLIDARNDGHIWADTYDRDVADVFAIQTEIAKTIAQQLEAKLSPPEKAALEDRPTTDLIAHDLYVRAKFLNEASSFDARRRDKLLQAVDMLNQAITRDPKFFLAYCLLANTHAILYFYGEDHTPERRVLVEAAVDGAAKLRPRAGETHLARADYLYRCFLDYDGARAELAIAQRSLPNNPQVVALLGYIDRRQSRWDESTRNLERALDLDPRNWFYLQQISLSYQYLRRYPEMVATLDKVLNILPDDVITRVTRAYGEMEWKGDTRPLRQTTDAVLARDPSVARGFTQAYVLLAFYERNPQAIQRAISASPPKGVTFDQVLLPRGFWKGLLARMQSDSTAAHEAFAAARQEIEQLFRDQPDYAPALCSLGLIDAGLGDKEKAITEGRRARELLPVEKENTNGVHMIEFLAVIYAWVGEKDRALEELTTAVHTPGIISYGHLRLNPFWDPLRGDPRFEKIVNSLAPK